MLTLDVQQRDESLSPEILRKGGSMPAVFYGKKEKATPIAINAQRFAHIWKEGGTTAVVTLTGLEEEKETLIREVQFHPVTGMPLHADFYVLEKGKKIEIKVPLMFQGEPPAEKAGHIVVKALHEIEIEVAPSQLPHDLPIDISRLENVGDHITAKEVKLPESASLLTDPDEIVVSVIEFKEEKVEIPAAPAEGEAAATEEGGEGEAPAPAGEATEAEKEKKE